MPNPSIGWAPNPVFEPGFLFHGGGDMDFGVALFNLKDGRSVRRKGWNGSGLRVTAQYPDAGSKMTIPYLYIEYPHDAKTTPGARCPWVPSTTDLMAEDWEMVE